ncbi:hypothetical protein [Mesorhizobium sp. M0047]|uniref:nSTAND1 domain-containing NTPase n=1 Tax=Mesorhizobium sp. M0047 TaxID=2956859 RepID=UPI00333AE93C
MGELPPCGSGCGNLHKERYRWFIEDAAWQAIASAAHDQEAIDVAGGQPLGKRDDTREHSPFAGALIRGLKGAADQASIGSIGDGVITATELYLYLENELLPKRSGGFRQTPVFWPLKKHDKGQFVFLVPGRALALPDAPPLDADANPWRGLEPYEARHAELFFGRGEVTKKLVERVVGDRFVVVTGPSGIGKSSLVKAGLLSRLKDDPRLEGKPLEPIVVRPGPAPFAGLARALRNATPVGINVPDETALKIDPYALAAWAKSRPGRGEVLLVIDQAEELITMSRDDAVMNSYLPLVDNALGEDEGRLRVVFTVRSEFEPQFAQSPLKDRWPHARFLVPPMTQDELRRVIEGPAAVKVMRFEPGELVEDLVNEVVQMPGALPLLSFALSQMYTNCLKRRSDDRTLTGADYKALDGGVTGSLRMRANELVGVWDEPHQTTARRVIEKLLSVDTRHGLLVDGLDVNDPVENARAERVMSRMEDAGLIVRKQENERSLQLAQDGTSPTLEDLLAWVKQAFDSYQETARRVLERFVSVDVGEFARRRVLRQEFAVAAPDEQTRVNNILDRLVEARLVVTDEVADKPYLELAHDALILGWDRLLNWVRQDALLIADLRRLTPDAEKWVKEPKQQTGRLWSDPERVEAVKRLQATASPGLNRAENDFADQSIRRARWNRAIRDATVLVLALLTVGAVWFAYSSNQQRTRSEANRLALASQLATQVDQSLLIAVASSRLESNFESKAALFSALTKRARLVRLLHGANGAIGDLVVLSNQAIVTRSSANSGKLLFWSSGSRNGDAEPISGVRDGFDDFVIVSGETRLVFRRGDVVEIYNFDAGSKHAQIMTTLTIKGAISLVGDPHGSLVYITTADGVLVTVSSSSGDTVTSERLPADDPTDGRLSVGDDQILAFMASAGIWFKMKDGWRQLGGPAPQGYAFVGLEVDNHDGLIIAALGVEQGRQSIETSDQGKQGFLCWNISTGGLAESCLDLEPIADPAEIGKMRPDIAFYSTRDMPTGYDRTEYRARKGGKWSREVLRIDPTFVSSLMVDDQKQTLLVGTIDGELGEYSLESFISGSAFAVEGDVQPLLTTWADGKCFMLVTTKAFVERRPCDNEGKAVGEHVALESDLIVQPEATVDGSSIFALTKSRNLILWDTDLRQVAVVQSPPGQEFSASTEVIYDKQKRRVIAVFDESNAIWTNQSDTSAWRVLAHTPFKIRNIAISSNGDSLFAGSATSGEVQSVDSDSGQVRFNAIIPSADFIGWMKTSRDWLFLSALTGRHSLFRLDVQTGKLASGDLNRFSGPARILAISDDQRYFVIEGVGVPNGKVAKTEGGVHGLTLELWDAMRLQPLGDGVPTNDYDRNIAAFSPDGQFLSLVLSSMRRAVTLSMRQSDWVAAACKMAGRELDTAERTRFSVPAGAGCS